MRCFLPTSSYTTQALGFHVFQAAKTSVGDRSPLVATKTSRNRRTTVPTSNKPANARRLFTHRELLRLLLPVSEEAALLLVDLEIRNLEPDRLIRVASEEKILDEGWQKYNVREHGSSARWACGRGRLDVRKSKYSVRSKKEKGIC